MSGKTRHEVLEEEFWMNWDSDTELHIYEDDETEAWCCTAYQCNDYSQFFGNEFKRIALRTMEMSLPTFKEFEQMCKSMTSCTITAMTTVCI